MAVGPAYVMRARALATLMLAMAACGSSNTAAPADATSLDGGDAVDAAADGGVTAATQEMVFEAQPDGSTGAPGPDTREEVFMMNLDGSARVQVTNDGASKFLPHLSPDGTKIAYTKFIVGGYGSTDAQTDLAVYDLATRTEQLITSGGVSGYATWSPDGHRLAYMLNPMISSIRGAQTAIYTINPDGTSPSLVAMASGQLDDALWPGDMLWGKTDVILFNVVQSIDGCVTERTDTIRPDGTNRIQITDGGPSCSVGAPYDYAGDADPGWSADGTTIYSSRALEMTPAGAPDGSATVRKLYSFSSDAWSPGKADVDLSLPSEPSCVEGVPRGNPSGGRILLFRVCWTDGMPKPGIFLTDTLGSYRTFIGTGFGPDWNPLKN